MPRRRVILTIDTLFSLLRDYCPSEDFPADACPIKLMVNPTEKRKLAILAQSDEWPADAAPLQINFRLQRFYGV